MINIEDLGSWIIGIFFLFLIYIVFILIKKSIRHINHNEIAAIPLLFSRRKSDLDDEIVNYRIQKGGFFFLPFYIPSSSVTILSSDIIKLSVKCSDMLTENMATTITADTILLFHIDFSSEKAQRRAFDSFGGLSSRNKNFSNDLCEKLEETIAAATRKIVGGMDIRTLTTDIDQFNEITFMSINDNFKKMGLKINSLELLNVRITNKDYEIYRDTINTEIQKREIEIEKGKTEKTENEININILKLKEEASEETLKINERDLDRDLILSTKQVNKEKALRQIELEKENNIMKLETYNKVNLKRLELECDQEEQKFNHQKLLKEEEYKISSAEIKIGRIDIEKEVIHKEEEHNLIKILANERSRAEADQIIEKIQRNTIKEVEEINFKEQVLKEKTGAEKNIIMAKSDEEISGINAKSSRNISEINLGKSKTDERISYYNDIANKRTQEILSDLIYQKLSAEAHGKKEMNQAMNESNYLTTLTLLLKENPDLIANIIEKSLGKDGASGIMKGLTKHLAGIESIRIADLGSTSSESSGLDKFIDLPPKILSKITSKLNALNIAPELIKKITSNEGSFDNLGNKDESSYKQAFNDSKNKENSDKK